MPKILSNTVNDFDWVSNVTATFYKRSFKTLNNSVKKQTNARFEEKYL
jgi:hypothetical protein